MSRVGEHRISKFLTRFIFKKLIDLTGLGGVEEGKEHETSLYLGVYMADLFRFIFHNAWIKMVD